MRGQGPRIDIMQELLVPIIVISLRLLVPFSVFRWPFWGAIAATLADAADIMIFEKFGIGVLGWERYHLLDKILDIYYLFFLLIASLRWQNVFAKRLSIILFSWRLLGVLLFEIIKWRGIFFFAPNIFENFYLAIAFFMQFFPKFNLNTKRIVVILVIAGIPKLIQEYIMHYIEFPTWIWIRDHFFFWMY